MFVQTLPRHAGENKNHRLLITNIYRETESVIHVFTVAVDVWLLKAAPPHRLRTRGLRSPWLPVHAAARERPQRLQSLGGGGGVPRETPISHYERKRLSAPKCSSVSSWNLPPGFYFTQPTGQFSITSNGSL